MPELILPAQYIAVNMLERIARALCSADGYLYPDEDWTAATNGVPNAGCPTIALPPDKRQRWRNYSRKAAIVLEVMWAPTQEMLESGVNKVPQRFLQQLEFTTDVEFVAEIWRAMIDEALKVD